MEGGWMKAVEKTFILVIICAVALSGMSCSRQNSPDKATNKALTQENAKTAESYKESMVEAKKTVIASVNGANISLLDLRKEINTIRPQYVRPGQRTDPKADAQMKKDALDRLIYRELAVQEAGRRGMKVAPEMVEKELKKLKAGLKTEEAYRAQLSKSGLTEEELKQQIAKGLLIDMITQKEVDSKVKVTESQMKKSYEEHKSHFKDQAGKQMTFEKARPFIEQKLKEEAISAREDKWIREMKKTARIEIMPGQPAQGSRAAK